MKKMAREFQTTGGRQVQLVGPYRAVQVWIDGKLRATLCGLQFAKRYAEGYCARHQ